MEEQDHQSDEALVAAFHRLDLDDSGFISVENMKAMLPEFTDDAIERVIASVSEPNAYASYDCGELEGRTRY